MSKNALLDLLRPTCLRSYFGANEFKTETTNPWRNIIGVGDSGQHRIVAYTYCKWSALVVSHRSRYHISSI